MKKSRYMLEYLRILNYSLVLGIIRIMPKNFSENIQVQTISRKPQVIGGSSETTRETPCFTKQYLLGVIKDSTKARYTYRISQKGKTFPEFIAKGINNLGYSAWVYKEGKDRDVYVVEFSSKLLENVKCTTKKHKIEYLRGYFDAEGGIAKSSNVRFYIYYCQKNYSELSTLKNYLSEFGISSGKIHNPSKRVDPNYWRFYISACSYSRFAKLIGSFHPEKSGYLRKMI